MNRHRMKLISAGIAIAAISLMVAACGSDSSGGGGSTSTPAAATTTAPAASAAAGKAKVVAVVLGKPNEFSLVPVPTSVPAGKVTFAVTNKGAMLHEMVVVPAPDGAAALKQPDGTASEAGSAGEVSDLEAGATGRLTVTLPAGKYALLCNLPGHFASGMYAGFTVG